MAEDGKNEDKWCFAWFQAAPPTTGKTKAALVKGSKWESRDHRDPVP